jgi:cholesterol 7-dehydrogenase
MLITVTLYLLAGSLLFVGFLYYQVFIHGKKRRQYVFDEEYERKRAAAYPPAFPNGWYNLCSSRAVKPGQVIEVEAFGQKLAVFRGEDGAVGVLDVYCPHLNANLAMGKVKGNRLECPFHAWQFNREGKCTHIPYTDKDVPANAATRAWTVKENWGLILVWYHAHKEAPTWHTDGYLPELETYKFHSKTTDLLRIHLQDFAENGADHAHFAYVHGLMTIPMANWFVEVKHRLDIVFCEGAEKHMAYFTDYADLVWKKSGKLIPHAGGKAVVTYFGPGFLVFKFETKIGNMLLVKTFTPLGPLKLRMDDYVYAPKGTFPLAIKYLLGEAGAQFKDDIAIWEKKSFTYRPVLVKGDGPIMKMRSWYSQFYSHATGISPLETTPQEILN